MNIYEVQKFGVSLEFGFSYSDAAKAFKDASPGEVVFYKISGGIKYPLMKK